MPEDNERLSKAKVEIKAKDDSKARNSLWERQTGFREDMTAQKADLNILGRTASSPLSASPAAITMLQRTAGNAAVMRMIQRKLSVGSADDSCELEADHIAGQVVNLPDSAINREVDDSVYAVPYIRRKSDNGNGQVSAVQNPMESFDVDLDAENRLNAGRGGGNPLQDDVRKFMEPRFGTDFSGVRVHTDSEAAVLNRKFSANAFTLGQDIYMDTGRYSPGTDQGKKLLAHELTHVVQQTGGGQSSSIKTMRIKTEKSKVQRDINGVTALVREHAGKDEKDGLLSFYNGLTVEQKKIAAQYVLKEGKIAKGDTAPDDVDDKAFKKKILSFFRSKFDWDVFSDAIRFAKASGASTDISPMHASSVTALGSTVTGAATSTGGVISGFAGAAQATSQIVGSVGSGLGALGSVVGAGAQAMELANDGPLSSRSVAEQGSAIGGNLVDTGRGISTSVQAANVAQGSIEAMSSTAATTAAGALAVIAGAVYLVSGIVSYFTSSSRGEGLEEIAGRRGAELETRMAGLTKQKSKLVEAKMQKKIASGLQMTSAKNDIEREAIRKEIERLDTAITVAQGKIDEETTRVESLKKLVDAAELGASTQTMKKHSGAATAAKGALMIAGGAVVIAAAASPVGWVLLAAAGIVGGVMAIYNWYKRKKRKQEIVDKYLNLDKKIEEGMENYDSKDKLRDRLLQSKGFNNVDQCYYSIVLQMAEELFDKGVKHRNAPENADYKKLVENLGFDVVDDDKPTIEQIAKKLHV